MRPTPTNHFSTSVLLVCLVLGAFVLFRIHARPQTKPPSNPNNAYKLSDGPFKVETVDTSVHDTKRNKDLKVRVLIPTGAGPFPVIVFSHGAGGSGENYFQLTEFWSTHGYVVLQPTHNDSLALRREMGEPLPSGPRELIDEYRFNADDWANRALDVSLILDSLSALEQRSAGLSGKMDQTRIGVGGHSYGAFTTQLIGGALVDFPNGAKAQSFRDSRPRALLLLSPQGKNQNGLTATSWKKMDRPMMSMTGTYDNGAMNQVAAWRKDPFTYSPAGDKYHVFINNAFHMSFSGALATDRETPGRARVAQRPLLAQLVEKTGQKAVFDYVKIGSIAFWDAYLKDEPKAKAYLKSDSLVAYSNNSLHIDRK